MQATPSFSDDLRTYIALAWRWAWLLALAAFLAGGSAFFVSKRLTPVYRASTLVLVNEAPANKTTDYAVLQTSERLARTYVEVMTTRPVLQGVIDRLGLTIDPNDLQEMVSAQPLRDTQLIEVSVESTDPVQAALIANTVVVVFSEQNQAEQSARFAASRSNLETQLASLDTQLQDVANRLAQLGDDQAAVEERSRLEAAQTQYRQTYAGLLESYEQIRLAEAQSTATVIQKEPALPPETPIKPRVLQNTALAAVVGLMLAAGIAFLVEALDDTVKDPDELARSLDLPVLGLIGKHDTSQETLVTVVSPRSPAAEAFRSLRTNLQYASVDRPLRTLLVTSPMPADGKSTIAANLAVVLAQSERKVALLDADLRKPRLHRMVRLPNRVGFTSLFTSEAIEPDGRLHLNGHLQATAVPNLRALTTGKLPPNPAELLSSERLLRILERVQEETDLVVLDSPPVLPVTDATVLATRVDGVLLVVQPGVTKQAAVRQAAEQLRQVGARVLGIVLNEVDSRSSRYRYYQGYHYRYKGYYAISTENEK